MKHVMTLSLAALLGIAMAGCSNMGGNDRAGGSSTDNRARPASGRYDNPNDPDGLHDSRVIANPGSSGGFGTGTPDRGSGGQR